MFFTKPLTAVATVALCAGTAQAESVEIYLIDMLDNIQDGYCLDIARAQGENADPSDGLQAHTCYSASGELMIDQVFDTEKFADGLLYMPEFDVCAQLASFDEGTTVDLAACDSSDAQAFVFSGEGTITPASATDMCLTATGDTRTGRSDENQMKTLALAACADDLASTQTWGVRTGE